MAAAAIPIEAPSPPPPVLKAPAGKAPITPTPTVAPNSLLGQANQEANLQVSGEVAPLAQQVSQAVTQSGQAQAGIAGEYKALLPSVADSASRLENFDTQMAQEQQGVYTQASQNLNALHQNAAADAQALAQRIGGPVSTGQFTAAVDPYQGAEAAGAANAALVTSDNAMSGARAAEQFAGQVLPAAQTEDQARSRTYYNDLISKIKDRIQTISATKGTLISTDLGKLQTTQAKNELDAAKLALSTATAAHNWQAKQTSLTQADQRLQAQIEEHQASLNETIRQHGITDSLTSQRLALTSQHDAVTEKLNQERTTIAEQKNAMALVDAAMAGSTGGKPVTLSVLVPIANPGFQLKPNPNIVKNKDGSFSEWTKRTLTPAEWAQQSGTTSSTGISDPNRLYQLLTGSGTPEAMARSIVKARLALPDSWKPGKKTSPAATAPLRGSTPTINLGEIPYGR